MHPTHVVDVRKGIWSLKKRCSNTHSYLLTLLEKECNPMHYTNIRVMLQLACTLPVTSCERERNTRTMRRLHTYMCTSMTQQRLSSLALLHIHYDVPIDLDKAVDIYSWLHPRRLALDSLIKPYNAVTHNIMLG